MQQKTKYSRRYVRDNNYDPKYFERSLDDFEDAIDALEDAEILYSSNYKIKAGTQQFYDENWEAIEEINDCTLPEAFLDDAIFTETVEVYPELGKRYVSLVKRLQRKRWDWLEDYGVDIDYDYLINHTYYIMSGTIDEDIESGRFDGSVDIREYINEHGREYGKKFEKDSRTVGRRKVARDSRNDNLYILHLFKEPNADNEFVIEEYKNGKWSDLENGSFSIDKDGSRVAWRDAVNLLKLLAKALDLSVEEDKYSVYAA